MFFLEKPNLTQLSEFFTTCMSRDIPKQFGSQGIGITYIIRPYQSKHEKSIHNYFHQHGKIEPEGQSTPLLEFIGILAKGSTMQYLHLKFRLQLSTPWATKWV
jgi:hypothetical protein